MSSLRVLLAACALCSATLVSAQAPGKTEVLWLGQATTRITTPGGKVIVVDSWLTSNPKTRANFKALEAQDAALATREMIRPKYALPVHYGPNPALRGTPAEFKAALGKSPVQMLAVEPGQKVEF